MATPSGEMEHMSQVESEVGGVTAQEAAEVCATSLTPRSQHRQTCLAIRTLHRDTMDSPVVLWTPAWGAKDIVVSNDETVPLDVEHAPRKAPNNIVVGNDETAKAVDPLLKDQGAPEDAPPLEVFQKTWLCTCGNYGMGNSCMDPSCKLGPPENIDQENIANVNGSDAVEGPDLHALAAKVEGNLKDKIEAQQMQISHLKTELADLRATSSEGHRTVMSALLDRQKELDHVSERHKVLEHNVTRVQTRTNELGLRQQELSAQQEVHSLQHMNHIQKERELEKKLAEAVARLEKLEASVEKPDEPATEPAAPQPRARPAGSGLRILFPGRRII